ncbi:SDR family oxidoreductase [Thermicanus aegyptius]|uniref:SDR family oxidoreductase n=1 Tax=Thermicanus aegyptius TaxID=94009 RepID=UPI000416954B|nr:SDR family oxidoreductase [Thermicanus aegyptius]
MIPHYPYFGVEWKIIPLPITFPPQHQDRHPGFEYEMVPPPIFDNPAYQGSGKLLHRVAIITGGDSGIGRAVAVAFAKEGADLLLVYLNEEEDARFTREYVEKFGRRVITLPIDLREPQNSREIVETALRHFGKIDVLVNNAAVQYEQPSLFEISNEQLENTFRTNVFSYFYLTREVLPYLASGSSIINTASITAYQGEKTLIDYSASKGAVVTFTRSLSLNLVNKGIRVNAVSPGPVWTPLIPSSFSAERVAHFGLETPMRRAAQPFELAPAYVYLASDDSSYVTGQVIHVNGGAMVES